VELKKKSKKAEKIVFLSKATSGSDSEWWSVNTPKAGIVLWLFLGQHFIL